MTFKKTKFISFIIFNSFFYSMNQFIQIYYEISLIIFKNEIIKLADTGLLFGILF